MAEPPAPAAIDPFVALAARFSAPVADLELIARPGCGIVTVMARGGGDAMLRERFRSICGFALPDGAKAAFGGDLAAIGTGPGSWLLVRDGASPDWAEQIAGTMDGTASIVDQSSAYAMLELRGEGARRLLQRGVLLDLHPGSFAAGSAAVTLVAHIGMILWQIDDAPGYRVAVFRSFARSFWHWIETAAAGLAQSR
jgi:sarcosine oxidase subunit gamma